MRQARLPSERRAPALRGTGAFAIARSWSSALRTAGSIGFCSFFHWVKAGFSPVYRWAWEEEPFQRFVGGDGKPLKRLIGEGTR